MTKKRSTGLWRTLAATGTFLFAGGAVNHAANDQPEKDRNAELLAALDKGSLPDWMLCHGKEQVENGYVSRLNYRSLIPMSFAEAREDALAKSGAKRLGDVDFPVSCNAAAQIEFSQGMAALHSFYWPEARRHFNAALRADRDCDMAHWGLAKAAMENPFAWPEYANLPEAKRQLSLIGPLKTPREQAYVDAYRTLLKDAETVPHKVRHNRYVQAMKHISEDFPDDDEAKALYALTLIANHSFSDKTYAQPLQAAAILEPLFKKYPNHPGLAHYLIHSYDFPPLAERGLPAARKYAVIAPDTPHALHMPSHIFTRLGLWEDSIGTNARSAGTAARENLILQIVHAQDYMVYAMLQRDQAKAAREIVADLANIKEVKQPSFGIAYALAAMPARIAVETDDWKAAARAELPLTESVFPMSRYPAAEAMIVYARAVGKARSGDADGARAEIRNIEALIAKMKSARVDMSYWIGASEAQVVGAEAWALLAEGKDAAALAMMRKARDMEERVEKSPVSPGPILPMRELMGDMLLATGQPAEALAAYEFSMEREPNRRRGYLGAIAAAKAIGSPGKASKYRAALNRLSRPPASAARPARGTDKS